MRLLPKFLLKSGFHFSSIVLAVSISGTASLAQQVKVSVPHRPISPKVKHPFPLPPAVLGSMLGGPWMVDSNFKSSIYIKNNVETSSITLTPILYLSNGARYTLPIMVVEPSGTAVLDIGASLQNLGIAPYATLSGYVELQYNWPWDPICATIRNLDATHSVVFSYGLRSSKPPILSTTASSAPNTETPNIVEGLWWKQEPNVTGFLALTNTRPQAMNVNVEVTDQAGASFGQHVLSISPHSTKMLDLNELAATNASSGGIRVTTTGKSTELLINGGLEDIGSGYSANIPFNLASVSTQQSTATVVELGLMTGPADPMMRFPAGTTFTPYTVLRNVSSSVLRVSPTVWWMAEGVAHSSPLPTISLSPYQTQTTDVPGLLAAAGIKQSTGTIQLEFEVQGNTGGLLLSAGSVDKTNTYVFEVTPHGISESASKSLSYWHIADGDDTMVTIWNSADEAEDLTFQLRYPGGHYNFPVHLEQRATRTFNISQIVESGIPDEEGNVIPVGVVEGSAKIMGSRADNEHLLVAMDAGVYNVRRATCITYCQTCNGVTAWAMAANPFQVNVAAHTQQTLYETWNTGSQYDDTSSSSWTTSNGGVATVGTPGSGTPGLVAGVNGGPVNISAHYSYNEPEYTSYWCEGSPWSCPMGYISGGGQAPGTVQKPTSDPIFSVNHNAAASCTTGFAGWNLDVNKHIADQNGDYILTPGQTLTETYTIGTNQLNMTINTASVQTNSAGIVGDDYFVCSTLCPGTRETDATQHPTDQLPGSPTQYTLNTNSVVYKCSSISVNGKTSWP